MPAGPRRRQAVEMLLRLVPPGPADANQGARALRGLSRGVEPERSSYAVIPAYREADPEIRTEHGASHAHDDRDCNKRGHSGLRTLPCRG